MNDSSRRRQLLLLPLSLAALHGGRVAAQGRYPNRPIKILVGFVPGGFTDVAARIVGEHLTAVLGQPVVIENRPGANGLIASETTARSQADGYTLHLCSLGLTTNALLSERPYDPVQGFTPISLLALVPNVLVVHPGVPAKTLRELLALARSREAPLTQASAGHGSPGHMSGALLQTLAKIRLQHVPYKGTGAAIADLLAGRVDMSFPTVPTALPFISDGKLRAIAVTVARRSPQLPDVPTIAEAGVPGYDTGGWYGLVGPRGMPPDVADLLSSEVVKMMKQPQVRARFLAESAVPMGSNRAEMAQFLATDFKRWREVVNATNMKPGELT